MPLTANKIYKCVTYSKTYQKGERYYLEGKVSDFTINKLQDSFSGYEVIKAVVRGTDDYPVTIKLDYSGNILAHSCECEAFKSYDGACKHIVAALIYRLNFFENMTMPQNVFRDSGNLLIKNPKRSDSIVTTLIKKCMRDELLQVELECSDEAQMLSLIPAIQLNRWSSAALSLTIGQDRQYVVKNIDDLCRNVMNQATVEYGKNLTCNHNINLFDDKSKRLIEILVSKYKEHTGNRSYYVGGERGRTWEITPAMLDKLFALYENEVLSLELPNGTSQTVLFTDEFIKIPLKATRVEGGVSISCHGVNALSGESFCYILDGERLYRCGSGYKEFYDNFLESLQRNKNKIFIAQEDLPDFFHIVVPSIANYATVAGAGDYLQEFLPDKLEIELYLDAPDKQTITAGLFFCYGGIKLNALSGEQPEDVKRDNYAETKASLLVKRFFDEEDMQGLCYRFGGDNGRIYRFISEVLPRLCELFHVFATDQFKSIKISAPSRAVIGVRVESDLLEIDILDTAFPLDELEGILAGYRLNKKYHRLKDGSFLTIADSAIESVAQLVDVLDISKKQMENGVIRMPLHRAMFVDSLMHGDEHISFKRDSRFKELIRTMKSVEDSDDIPPKSLETVLRNYQKVGFRWLKTMERCGFSGILADDMGLGKTLQVIALLLSAKEAGSEIPSLIVCPSSLVFNWMDEFVKFAPTMRVLPIIGTAQKRAEDILSASRYDVLITSYDLLKRDVSLYEQISFYYQVIDEAQFIKNHTTKAAQGAKGISSRYRCALTGTPVENRISELWSIFDFLMPGYLYHYGKFREKFEQPIVKEQDAITLGRLEKMVAPFVLRRMKKDVLKELPDKTEMILYASMEEEQEKLYLANLSGAREEMNRNGSKTNKIAIFAMLTRLRQLCCDPALCYENYTGGSGKLETCMELVREAVSGQHKILLFSQFTSMLSIIEQRLNKEGITYFKLQGSTPKEERHSLVERFNRDDTQVFLISLKAGGTGLNLTAADVVIHYDPWWNLAAQNQATDRAYRIGQTNNVNVYKLITKNTIEEKIVKLQLTKKDLVDSVIKEGEGLLSSMTKEELFELF